MVLRCANSMSMPKTFLGKFVDLADFLQHALRMGYVFTSIISGSELSDPPNVPI